MTSRDYMLALLFLRYLSDNYETAAKKELGNEYPNPDNQPGVTPLRLWYADNLDDVSDFENSCAVVCIMSSSLNISGAVLQKWHVRRIRSC